MTPFLTSLLTTLLICTAAAQTPNEDIAATQRLLETRYSIPGGVLQIDANELARQAALSGNITFAQAVDTAMRIFLTSTKDDECPLSIQMSSFGEAIIGIDPSGELPMERSRDRALGALLAQLYAPDASLRLVGIDDAPEGYDIGFVLTHWAFQLRLPGDEHGYWAIIERQGTRPAFCFGFN